MEVRYVPGTGVLLASGQRWLLVDATSSSELVDPLWELLVSSAPALEPMTALLVDLLGEDVSFAMLDATPHSPGSISRGAARVISTDSLRTLSLRPDRAAGSLRLVAGVVPADAVDLRPDPARPPVAGLIDQIPPHILASRAPHQGSRPAPHQAPATVVTQDPEDHTVRRAPSADPDHDGHTTLHRTGPPGGPPTGPPSGPPTGPPTGPPPAPPAGPAGHHLQQHTHETVLAVRCPAHHLSAAFTPTCRVCAAPVAPQEPQRVPRPQLGLVRLPEGDTVPLDRGVVFGRQPTAPPGSTDWPHLVRLTQGSSYVSRTHLKLELDGWLVLATDLGSRGGTTLRVPGRPPERIRAHETYVWEPGQVLDLADSYEILYETTTGTGGTP